MKILFFILLSLITINLFSQKNFNGTIKYKLTIIKNENDTTVNYLDIVFTDTMVIVKYKEGRILTEVLDIKTGDFTTYCKDPVSVYTSKGSEEDNIEKHITNKQIFSADTIRLCNKLCTKASLNYKEAVGTTGATLEILGNYYLSDLYFSTGSNIGFLDPFHKNSFNKIPLLVYETEEANTGLYNSVSRKLRKYEAISIEPSN